jgi:hypothetical protein
MKAKQTPARRRDEPQILYRNGRPSAVLLDIKTYEDLLRRAEDLHDLQELQRRRNEPQVYRSFDEYLDGRDAG